MSDIDIDPFGEHDKMDNCPDEGEMIPFNLMGSKKWDPFGSWNKKYCLVGGPITSG